MASSSGFDWLPLSQKRRTLWLATASGESGGAFERWCAVDACEFSEPCMRRSAGVCHSAVLSLQHASLLLVRRRFVKRFILLMLPTCDFHGFAKDLQAKSLWVIWKDIRNKDVYAMTVYTGVYCMGRPRGSSSSATLQRRERALRADDAESAFWRRVSSWRDVFQSADGCAALQTRQGFVRQREWR